MMRPPTHSMTPPFWRQRRATQLAVALLFLTASPALLRAQGTGGASRPVPPTPGSLVQDGSSDRKEAARSRGIPPVVMGVALLVMTVLLVKARGNKSD